jgi:crossover junction endodeoxyribonuclease RusA
MKDANIMIKLIIPEIPPSNNKYMGNSNSHHIYRKEKEKWAEIIMWEVKSQLKKIDAFQKAVVKLKYFFKDSRRRDPDNYSGKFILDGLVKAGVLVDDSFDCIKLELESEVDKKNPRIEIEIRRRRGK